MTAKYTKWWLKPGKEKNCEEDLWRLLPEMITLCFEIFTPFTLLKSRATGSQLKKTYVRLSLPRFNPSHNEATALRNNKEWNTKLFPWLAEAKRLLTTFISCSNGYNTGADMRYDQSNVTMIPLPNIKYHIQAFEPTQALILDLPLTPFAFFFPVSPFLPCYVALHIDASAPLDHSRMNSPLVCTVICSLLSLL